MGVIFSWRSNVLAIERENEIISSPGGALRKRQRGEDYVTLGKKLESKTHLKDSLSQPEGSRLSCVEEEKKNGTILGVNLQMVGRKRGVLRLGRERSQGPSINGRGTNSLPSPQESISSLGEGQRPVAEGSDGGRRKKRARTQTRRNKRKKVLVIGGEDKIGQICENSIDFNRRRSAYLENFTGRGLCGKGGKAKLGWNRPKIRKKKRSER